MVISINSDSQPLKCDRGRPVCGRCAQRNLDCTGLSSNTGYLFLNENDTARRNSQRARGEGGNVVDIPLNLNLDQAQAMPPDEQHQALTYDERSRECLQITCPWLTQRALASIPEPLRRSVEDRAVERFFTNWVLFPGRNGTPGHMANLPVLFYGASADSVLAHAVRTVAFADVKHTYDRGISFSLRARHAYGAALSGIRGITELESEMASDEAFAALLLIDSFEVSGLTCHRNGPDLADCNLRPSTSPQRFRWDTMARRSSIYCGYEGTSNSSLDRTSVYGRSPTIDYRLVRC